MESWRPNLWLAFFIVVGGFSGVISGCASEEAMTQQDLSWMVEPDLEDQMIEAAYALIDSRHSDWSLITVEYGCFANVFTVVDRCANGEFVVATLRKRYAGIDEFESEKTVYSVQDADVDQFFRTMASDLIQISTVLEPRDKRMYLTPRSILVVALGNERRAIRISTGFPTTLFALNTNWDDELSDDDYWAIDLARTAIGEVSVLSLCLDAIYAADEIIRLDAEWHDEINEWKAETGKEEFVVEP